MYKIALREELYLYSTPNERRIWTDTDKNFILNNEQKLTVSQTANIVHKSYNATLMYIKTIRAYDMIN